MEKNINILVVTYWSFSDALIKTYTLPYLERIIVNLPKGSTIYLVTMEKENYGTTTKTGSNIVNIKFKYSPFGIHASFSWIKNIFLLNKIIKQNHIQFIHAFCTPAGMIGYILSKLSGKRLVLDSYEPHAESMVENGEWKSTSLSYKFLFYFEKKQTRHAYKIICATNGMEEYALKKYGIQLTDYFVKPACVDLQMFNLNSVKDKKLVEELKLENKMVCVYAGKFGGIYLKKKFLNFIRLAIKNGEMSLSH